MTNSTQIHNNVIPSEVGWQFVPQYYTFVNKQPHRLHCFYTKASTFIHGTEGEDGKPCFGQQEIHNRITAIGFQDCKVFIHSVDAQSSANGGIIIQVIGEMSNRGEPWRKFVQTFFLAEQPNGYFVLNDIFRFLKEETVDSDDDREDELPAQDVPAPSVQSPAVPILEEPPVPEIDQEPASAPSPVSPTEELPIIESVPELQPNGVYAPVPVDPEPDLEPIVVEKSPVVVPSTMVLTPEHPATSPSPAPSASAPQSIPSPGLSSQQLGPPSQVAAPSAPKTWANLAATNPKKWGSAVAQESRGTTEVPATTALPNGPQSAAPAQPHRDHHPAYTAAQTVTTPQCFVKGVIDTVPEAALRHVITQRFGTIKELEIVRTKACAFLEFVNLDSAKRAITASLTLAQGGGGGVRIDIEGGQNVKIFVETRKERGERPVSRPRGGGPNQGVNGSGSGGGNDGRGSGFRGRGGSGGGRGRGSAAK